ncbi:hypothetical protein LTR08_005146 [Meristemomyces frigidus]|nr:hypothetical protein LTR08_005146 [Meristemomyces frigidus]
MVPLLRRWLFYAVLATAILFILIRAAYTFNGPHIPHRRHTKSPIERLVHPGIWAPKFKWSNVASRHPVEKLTVLPSGPLAHIPQIQHDFETESRERRSEREARLAAVLEAFEHSWDGYKKNAWMQDEVAPVSGECHNGFGGWAATLVDSLDTLWIMGLRADFEVAVSAIRRIDFTTTPLDELNIFETTIRHLGGLLSAYDVSGQKYKVLLDKATELGHMLYVAFDTPNRMPMTRWDWKNAALGGPQQAARNSLLAEVGLSLEFTRLSQLTGDNKWYDAIARIMDVFEDSQSRTKIPGLWPVFLDTKHADFTRDTTFSIGGMADSHYEHFPKQHLMLGGRSEQYRNMYSSALDSAKANIFFRVLNPENKQLLLAGTIKRHTSLHINLIPEAQHLTCFAGGMVALAAKVFSQPHELSTARQLLDGCLWAYDSMPSGIMPESFHAAPCKEAADENCTWTDAKWFSAIINPATTKKKYSDVDETPEVIESKAHATIKAAKLVPGFTRIVDSRYLLRPEAIESLFVLYRITGDHTLQDKAWNMFQSISIATKTPIAYAGITDVTELDSKWIDTMESFWTAETLKYFYLMFSKPDVISLDDYVL